MHPAVKFALDLGPLVTFFVGFYAFGIYPATGIFMIATVLAAAISFGLVRRVSPLMIFSAVVVLIFGGLTLWLKDETFIKLKPTIYYLAVSGILSGGLVFNRLVIKDVMELAMPLTDEGWTKFTIRVAIFFLCMAGLNVFVAENYSFETWLWMKVWGFIPLTAVFFMAQVPLLMRYEVKNSDDDKAKPA